MDVAETSWEALQKAAEDKDGWRARVHTLKKAARGVMTKKSKNKPTTTTHQLHSQRFTFFHKQTKKRDKKTKKTSNAAARSAHYDRLTAPAVAQEKMHKLLSGHTPAHRPTPTITSLPPIPTWDTAVAAVFSDSSSYSTCGTPTYDYDSNADFIPKCNLPPWTAAAPPHDPQTPIRPKATTNYTTPTNTPNDNNSELWAQSLPSHMLPSPSPPTTKASHHSILNDTEPWAKSLPSHMMPSPSPSTSTDSLPFFHNHHKKSKNIMNDTLNVSTFEPNLTELTNTDLKCPILYNHSHSQPDLVLPSLQKIPLSPILPPPISPTTKPNEIPRKNNENKKKT